jgi:adenine/guanine phosphoribosyltransferase-like PRPP-binding protein
MRIKRFEEYLTESANEGVSMDGDNFDLNFGSDSPNDIMSLAFSKTKPRKMVKDGVQYSYYFAYDFDNKKNKDFLKAVKMMDERISPSDLSLMLNKAVIGLNRFFPLNEFDAIVYPQSSSIVLKELAAKVAEKSGNAESFPDVFVKRTGEDLHLDVDKVEALPEKTKKEVYRALEKAKSKGKNFKIKEIFTPLRKFFKDFLIFNSEDDRRLINAITGQRVILIDDYRTSGTTIKEMLEKLIELGPAEIVVLVLIKVE